METLYMEKTEAIKILNMETNEKQLMKCQNVLAYVKQHAVKGNANSVIEMVDKYIDENVFAIHVGDDKGKILDSVVEECNPKIAVELGTHFGYSAIRIGRLLKPGSKLYSIEFNPEFMKIANEMVEFAGLADKVTVILGKSSDVLERFKTDKSLSIASIDFALIDHWKDVYKEDLILMENLKLLKKGSVILADNIIFPGVPDYTEYVRNNPNYKCTTYPGIIQKLNIKDAMEKSVFLCD